MLSLTNFKSNSNLLSKLVLPAIVYSQFIINVWNGRIIAKTITWNFPFASVNRWWFVDIYLWANFSGFRMNFLWIFMINLHICRSSKWNINNCHELKVNHLNIHWHAWIRYFRFIAILFLQFLQFIQILNIFLTCFSFICDHFVLIKRIILNIWSNKLMYLVPIWTKTFQ